MERLVIASDIHIRDAHVHGKPQLPVGLGLLDRLCDEAFKRDSVLVIAGDLIHQKLSFPINVYLGVLATFERWADRGLKVYWIRGNHETPDKEHPSRSLMRLFDGLVTVVNDRPMHVGPVAMVPWFPAERMRAAFDEVRNACARTSGNKYLISHVGLKEGKVAPSNFYPPSDMSVSDLHPKAWTRVYLGDYHAHQFVADNVLYCGAPIPHTFGDAGNQGAWFQDTKTDAFEVIKMPGFPSFKQWDLDTLAKFEKAVTLVGGDVEERLPGVYLRLRVRSQDYDRACTAFRGAEILVLAPTFSAVSLPGEESRMPGLASVSHEEMLHRWAEFKHMPDEIVPRFVDIGLQFIREAM